MGASIVSSVVNVINMDKASIAVSWSGTVPVGTLSVEARNGESASWYTLDFNVSMDVSGNTGAHQIVFNELPFTDIRLNYNRTSGTGTMDAIITMKVVGG